MRSQRFTIAAKIPAGISGNRVPEMLQTLLAERFKLSIHRENQVQSIYALVVGSKGAKLQDSTADADAPIPETPGSREMDTPQGGGRAFQTGGFVVSDGATGPVRAGWGANGAMKFEYLKLTMPVLAALLTPHVDHPVLDMTNLKGTYYLASQNSAPSGGAQPALKQDGHPEGPAAGPVAFGPPPREDDRYGEGLLRAIQKAGLKLEARKAPIEVVVVDRLEKNPTAN